MSHRIALVLSRSSPKLASRPLSLLYPETELIYSQAYSPLGMGVRHIVPLDSSGEGGILPYPQWEPLPALTENMQPLHYTMVTLSAAGERTASPLRPPIFSVVMPTLAAKDITFRHFDLPVLSHSVLPLSIGMYPAPRASSWPSLNMPLVYAVRSDLTRIYSFDSENRESEGAALGEEQAEEGETDATTSWAPMKETQPSFHPMLPQQALSPSMELVSIKTPFSSSQPGALKPEKVGLTFAASLLGEVMRRQREMLVSDREEASAEAGLPSIVTMPPPRLQSLAVSKPHEPYLTREASDGLPTMAIHRGDDLLTSAMPQAQSAAFGKPLSHGRLPWANKALFSSRQWARKLKGDDDLYSTFNPTLEMAGLITDGEGALAPSYEEIEPSAQALYGSEPVPLPLVGEANDTLMALGDALARPYPKMDLWAETTTRPPSWSGGSARPKVSSPSSLSPYPPAPMGGYGGFSLPPVASSITPSQGSSSQPTVARAPIDRPTGGDQTGETEQGAPLDEIAEEVYAILKRRLALERERSWGIG